jgi:hypothetical protein
MNGPTDPGLRVWVPRAGEHVQLQINGVLAQLRRHACRATSGHPFRKQGLHLLEDLV